MVDQRAEAGGHAGAMAFLQGNALRLAEGQEQVALPPQQVIYALGLCDYLDDAAVVALLDWAHDHLADGGAAIVSNLDRGNPDREFLAHVLEWKLNHRAPDDLRDLFARSRFGDAPLDVRVDETGVTLLATCARRG